ncbi:hypothetical protein GCM10011351_20630 [Paraliobacillus quinghaiensis]|uniref:Uncharacterized protein n=1 Tax=Paraliobacillus quinghaiensis TaxID=470815 RepID=A0A917WVX4_9BACI|nr:hypothetical protein [Paraliobacillus quinghaiensis]GGM34546.1 hypothetical protein GCM10011351_20630 [Paraliobacillus quinghaiensis]
MRKIQKLLVGILSLAMVTSQFAPFTVEAASTTKLDNKVNIVNKGENSWEYIQEIDSETYKIIEESDPNTGEVTSYVKKKNDNGEFVLEKTHYTKPIENGIEVETIENGSKTIEQINTDYKIKKSEKIDFDNNLVTFDNNLVTLDNDELTPWLYSYTSYNDINFSAITVGIVSAALSSALGLPSKASFIFSAATTIASSFIPTVYTKQVRYVKNMKGTTILAGIMDYNYIYEYSNFTGLIEAGTEIDCATGFVCN